MQVISCIRKMQEALALLCFGLEVGHITSTHSLLARPCHMTLPNCKGARECERADGLFGKPHRRPAGD